MGKVLQGTTSVFSSGTPINTTVYGVLGSGDSGIGNTTATTEANVQIKGHSPGTFSNFGTHVQTNTLTTAALTLKFRKNTADGNQVLSIAAGTTGFFTDASNSDAIVNNDLFNFKLTVANSGSGSVDFPTTSITFQSTTNHDIYASSGVVTLGFGVSTPVYYPLMGYSNNVAAEASAKQRIKQAVTLKNAQIYVVTGTTVGDPATLTSRKNGAAGAISISITGNTTGLFEDTSNSDSLASGDDSNWKLDPGILPASFKVGFISGVLSNTTNAKNNLLTFFEGLGQRNASATVHFQILTGGGLSTGYATVEANAQIQQQFASSYSNFLLLVIANTYGASVTAQVRVNTANGNELVSITNGVTGIFEDVTNTDSIAAGDKFCWTITGGTSGSATIEVGGILSTIISGSSKFFLLFK